jgi:hypothetical protein
MVSLQANADKGYSIMSSSSRRISNRTPHPTLVKL